MSGEKLDAAMQKINAILAAIERGDLQGAQKLSDAMMAGMRGGGRSGGGRSGRGRGGE